MDAINQPLLDVRELSVAFRQGGATLAVDQVSFQIRRGEMRGAGRRVRLRQIGQRALDPEAACPIRPPRIPRAASTSRARNCSTGRSSEMREIRGSDISIIFQEPMTSLNPLHTIEAQIGEIIQLHNRHQRCRGAQADAGIADAGRHSRA